VSRGRIVVAGLGPAAPDLVTAGTRAAIGRIGRRFLRTARHPSAPVADEGPGEVGTFDGHYESGATFDDVYRAIVEDLVAAAQRHGEVLYLVPGSPRVLERSVDRLLADDRVEVEVLPAMSFLDLAWVRLGVDPLEAGARLVDGHRFAEAAAGQRGPLLVAHCHNQRVLSDIKLAYDEDEPPEVVVLARLGLPDEDVRAVAWADLDREVAADHLTSLWIPQTAPDLGTEAVRFHELVRRLRAECPWDREQTHASLTRHLLEESYEVLEALDHLDPDAGEGFEALGEELGDLLFQVVFHAVLAAEEGHFTLAEVTRGIHDKLRDRHPHVFGEPGDEGADVTTVEELSRAWEQAKVAEKGRDSVMDGIPVALPALLYALKVQKKAASQGVDWRDLLEPGDATADLARRLLDLVDEARAAGVDPETELRAAAVRLRDRFNEAGRSGG
jgi:tetrapyrrole methylase family protein / MazG family protein